MYDCTNEEQQLILKIKEGSYKDFELLYNLYSDKLYSFIVALTKSQTEAKDVVQEVFLRVWQKKEEIIIGTSFKAYLFNIGRNLVIDSFRKNLLYTAPKISIDNITPHEVPVNTTEDQAELNDFLALLSEAKTKLTSRQRMIFELSKEHFLSNKEIADRLNISEKTVRNQLSTALSTIRQMLSQYPLYLLLFVTFFIDIRFP